MNVTTMTNCFLNVQKSVFRTTSRSRHRCCSRRRHGPMAISTCLVALIVYTLLVPGQSLAAEPAVLRDGILTIPEAVVLESQPGSYYRNVTLEQDANGKLQVIAAEPANLAMVDSVDVEVSVTVEVSGNKSVPCVDLQTPAVSREGNVFTVILAETPIPDGVNCATVLEPFTSSVTLHQGNLEPGTYTVRVNGTEMSFTVPEAR